MGNQTKFEFTKEQLIQAFEAYNRQMLESPQDFGEITDSRECAEAQAGKLISILEDLPVNEG